jgi:hypothetical protein
MDTWVVAVAVFAVLVFGLLALPLWRMLRRDKRPSRD